jgi:hypothetical protein
MIHEPISSAWLFFYAGLGAIVLWGKLGKDKRKAYVLGDLLDKLLPPTWIKTRVTSELLIFVALGSVVAVSLVQPATTAQAVAAGLGWTGLASR